MKILLIGAGVIGTAYAVNLAAACCKVYVLAHGIKSEEISKYGLRAIDLATGKNFQESVEVLNDPSNIDFDLVLISVRHEQLTSTFSILYILKGNPTLLFFGNNPNGRAALPDLIPKIVELGFPGIGGSIAEGVVKYIRISQQPTTLQTNASIATQNFIKALRSQGFEITSVSNMDGWLFYHTIFISCIAAALYQSNTNPLQLSKNRPLLKLMCTAITEGFSALKNKGITGLPGNLSLLHKPWLRQFAIFYWRRTFRSSMGELCFAAHARSAKMEMKDLANSALESVSESKYPLSNLRNLLKVENVNKTIILKEEIF